MKIDCQCHIMRTEYLSRLEDRPGYPTAQRRDGQYTAMLGEGYRYTHVAKLFDIETKLRDMEADGIDLQMLTQSIPGPERLEPELGIALAQQEHDYLAELIGRYPQRFTALATLPLQAMDAALKELDRAIGQLGLRGVQLFSNINGKPVDAPEFWPLYARAEELDVPIFIHPTYPVMAATMTEYNLIPSVGFMFETTLAAMRLIYSGILERHPRLRVVLPHMGSTIPYLMGRIDWRSKISGQAKDATTKSFSDYFKRIYVDSANPYVPALRYGYQLIGADRILFASDYPFREPSIAVAQLEELDLATEEKEKIYHGNARTLLKLPANA